MILDPSSSIDRRLMLLDRIATLRRNLGQRVGNDSHRTLDDLEACIRRLEKKLKSCMREAFFVYAWRSDPSDYILAGPWDTREEVKNFATRECSNYDGKAIIGPLPFEEI